MSAGFSITVRCTQDTVTPHLKKMLAAAKNPRPALEAAGELGITRRPCLRPPLLEEWSARMARNLNISPETFAKFAARKAHEMRMRKARAIAEAKARAVIEARIKRPFRGV